jgi:hypothetical protein
VAYASQVPAVFARLLVIFARELAPTEVRDGPQTPDTSAVEAVYVGWTGDETHASDAWTSTETPEGLQGQANRESFAVHCSAMVVNNDGDLAAARSRALALRAAAGDAIMADPTLGKTVLRAVMSAGAGLQMPTKNGMKVHVLFDVDVDAYARS